MEIGLIISGNLTGFTRFYSSPDADELYLKAKFDFDYRNFLTFLKDKERTYAISFSPKIIAVSLITRILDSFRRPGVLVVTVLIPRNQRIADKSNESDKTALYRLLNEINDRFYEKNFLKDMINQNPSILSQDIYSDILSQYKYVNDGMQRSVNTTIDPSAPNKRVGYVATEETEMPAYLSNIIRKSYSGYNPVFLAKQAPQNIQEPPEEVLTYHVRIENGNQNVPGEVRMTDRIPQVRPEPGELPIANTNFTYGQVLNGEAGNDIKGRLENNTIVISFRFPKEEKTLQFKFFDGALEVPVHILRPVFVESDGTSIPLPSDSFTFLGKEIYTPKTIKIGNPDYIVDQISASLNLQRYNNGATVSISVRRGWELNFVFNEVPQPKTITLKNKITREELRFDNVTNSIRKTISGSPTDWEMVITSDYYDTVVVPANTSYINLRRKQPVPDERRGGGGGNISNNHSHKISGGANDTAKELQVISKEKKKNLIQKGIFGLAALLVLIGGVWICDKFIDPDNPSEEISDDTEPIEKTTEVTKNVFFLIQDGSKSPKITKENLGLLKLEVKSDSAKIETSDEKDEYNKTIIYNSTAEDDSVNITVSLKDSTTIIFAEKTVALKDLSDTTNIILNVYNSELEFYRQWKNGYAPKHQEVTRITTQMVNRGVGNYSTSFVNLLIYMKPSDSTQDSSDSSIDWSVLDRVDASLSTIDKLEKEAQNKGEIIPEQYQNRIKALKYVINYIKKGKKPSAEGLSKAQRRKLLQIWPMEMKDGEKQPKNLSTIKGQFKNIQSIQDLENKFIELEFIEIKK